MAFISFQPSDHFNTLIYSGTGGNGTTTTQGITGAGFQPDLVWLKQRTSTQSHQICDVIRGANNIISSNSNNAQVADSEIINSFDSDGFTAGYQDQANDTGQTYVSWLWKAGGAGSANTDGALSSTVSVNTTAGISLTKYTGGGAASTVGHGLGVAPKIVLIKDMTSANDWRMYHASYGNQSQLSLSQTSAADSGNTTMWNSTSPTSTVFSIGTHGNVSTNSSNYIAYCFAEKKGFSKFGKYTGNGSTNGPFIFCGFKPALVIFKKTNDVGDWQMVDDKRAGYNPNNYYLQANANLAEQTTNIIDLVSNGFKIRGDDSNGWNKNGSTYAWLAFAEEPLVASNGTPATAR